MSIEKIARKVLLSNGDATAMELAEASSYAVFELFNKNYRIATVSKIDTRYGTLNLESGSYIVIPVKDAEGFKDTYKIA